jgi:hypothetical protein
MTMTEVRPEFHYLNQLRASGAVNMFGAAPHIESMFDLTRKEARQVVSDWMKWVSADPARLNEGDAR